MARLLVLKKHILEKQLVCAYVNFILLLAAIPSANSWEYQKHEFSNDC